jgi:hypothetical protein
MDKFEQTTQILNDDLIEEQNMAINEMGELNKSKKKKEEDLIQYTSFMETEDAIYEQINISYNNNKSDTSATRATHATPVPTGGFCKYHKESGTIEILNSFIHQNKEYRPIVDDLVKGGIVLLPNAPLEYGTDKELIEEIKLFLYQYFEVPGFFKDFLPYLVMFYWVYEKFPFIPYLHFLGRTGTGKSTAMEVLGSICYKPIDASGAITMASIFRVASTWKGTLMLDEFNAGGDNYQEMLSLLKSGVTNKAVLRVEGEGKKEVKAFLVKSPKIFTSEKPVTDAGLRSRIIEVKMEQNKLRVPLYRLNKFLVKAQELRSKLLMWRLRKLCTINLDEIEYGFKELQGFQGRVQQVITPIYYMADDISRKEIAKFAIEQQQETLRERRDAIDGQVFDAILDKYNNKILASLVSITEVVNKGSKYPLTERKIAGTVRKILGFDIQRVGHDMISTVMLENQEDRISELCEYYGIPLKENGVAQVADVADESQDLYQRAEVMFGS